MFDYFYGAQSDQFSFYRVPKVMFTDPAFQNVSAEAKILYGLFLDRMGLSARNNWVDEQGRVYIIYTIDQIMKAIGCSDKKVNRMLRELEVVAGLIERKRQGLGKPNLIYVKNFLSVGQNGRFLNRKMDDSGVVETQILESAEVRGSNTEINNTEYIPDDGSMSAQELSEMVSSINESEVAPGDRLADVAFHYDADEHIFEKASAFEERMAAREEMAVEQPETITVLMVNPGERPYEMQVGTELEDLQAVVGGSIEVAYPFEDNVGLIMNEEGKLEGLPLNRALRDDQGEVYDIVAGPFMVVGLTEDSFGSLSKEQLSKFSDMFQQPEGFIKMGKSIMAFPVPEETADKKPKVCEPDQMGKG